MIDLYLEAENLFLHLESMRLKNQTPSEVVSAIKDKLDQVLIESTANLILNAQMYPDPRMGGSTDCFLVTLDDYNALVSLLESTGKFKAPGA